jgi:very-short-patch-repair endonuclease
MLKRSCGLRCATDGSVVLNSCGRAIGSYVVDFVCREKNLVIEVDGGQHADNPKDRARDAALSAEGYNLLRFWNSEILTNEEGVLSVILAKLQGRAL